MKYHWNFQAFKSLKRKTFCSKDKNTLQNQHNCR